ncbi:hypothetical protein Sjap_013291 [Stephania japonica]|uniref:Pentatricopeptide repeat-containing protein n=1 Tax=Stephania japonica TaxID=461633 RepID=A0AAP0IXQ9_9MAGN
MRNEGTKVACTISSALSSWACVGALEPGVQLHCLALKIGIHMHVYVGSSLISLYAKCGRLKEASKVFNEMPVKNVVSWTSLIDGFAQNRQLEMSIEVYGQMRFSSSKPNDVTYTILVSACTESGFLGHGRSAHCQTIQLGFDSFTHVVNALISMYAKSGLVKDSFYVFRKLGMKDLISWNSMISAYAQHGLADDAIHLLKEMENKKVQPDAITFLGVLSSCRHAGLVEKGRLCFESMLHYGIVPNLDHYSCIVDLLGRAGLLQEALEFIKKMPIRPNAIIWGSLLSSCKLQGNVWIGIEAAKNRLLLDPTCAATHVQLANLYANAQCWDDAARVRKRMKDGGLKTDPGYSWVEIKNEVYRFKVEDSSNPRMNEILFVVDSLIDNMKRLGYVPRMDEEQFDP